jgi:hypothetical protein
MAKKKIGGLLFNKTKTGLHYIGVAGKKAYGSAKYLHGAYKSHKAGELTRLKEKAEKEKVNAQIRNYRQQYRQKGHSNFLKGVGDFFSPSKTSTSHVRHVKHHFPKKHRHHPKRVEYW